MLIPIISGLIVSVDAFFIGLSLGLQEKCRFVHLVCMNVFLFALSLTGYFIAGQVYERIPFEPDYIVGFTFIALGVWTMLCYFVTKRSSSPKTIVVVGLVMSLEAMLITMGITFIFSPGANLAIPVTVALAHFAYSAFSFGLARTKYAKRIPLKVSYMVSGGALVLYGVMALVI